MAANPNYSEVIATSLENRKRPLADGVTEHNAALTLMKQQDGVRPIDGGSSIIEPVTLSAYGASSYAGLDLLSTARNDTVTAAQFKIAQYAVPVVMSGLEEIQNAGDEQVLDLLTVRVDNAESSLTNLLNQHFYLDGTGNNGKNIIGLAASIPLANTTGIYGGIDRSLTSGVNWRNKKYQATVDSTGGIVATSTTLIGMWQQFYLQLVRGTDKPSCILAAPNMFSMYEAALTNMQRITDINLSKAGFTTLMFKDVPVVFDTAASGISANVAYFLNTKYLSWRPHKARQFKSIDARSTNQDADVTQILWAGQLTGNNSRFQGVFSNT